MGQFQNHVNVKGTSGCPILALLYIFVAEIQELKIWGNIDIQVFKSAKHGKRN